jgi:hypothetical protein
VADVFADLGSEGGRDRWTDVVRGSDDDGGRSGDDYD